MDLGYAGKFLCSLVNWIVLFFGFVIVWLIHFLLNLLLQDDGTDEIKEPLKADNEQ